MAFVGLMTALGHLHKSTKGPFGRVLNIKLPMALLKTIGKAKKTIGKP